MFNEQCSINSLSALGRVHVLQRHSPKTCLPKHCDYSVAYLVNLVAMAVVTARNQISSFLLPRIISRFFLPSQFIPSHVPRFA